MQGLKEALMKRKMAMAKEKPGVEIDIEIERKGNEGAGEDEKSISQKIGMAPPRDEYLDESGEERGEGEGDIIDMMGLNPSQPDQQRMMERPGRSLMDRAMHDAMIKRGK